MLMESSRKTSSEASRSLPPTPHDNIRGARYYAAPDTKGDPHADPHPTLDKLHRLRLPVMAQGLRELIDSPSAGDLSFEERLGLLAERELLERENKKLVGRLAKSRIGKTACLEEIDYRASRGLDRSLVLELAGGGWIKYHRNLLIIGPTGVGKTFLARALGHQVCL